MAAGIYNFSIEQGSTVDFTIQYKDSGSNPIDLTYYNARMDIRPTAGSSTLYLNVNSEDVKADGTGMDLTPPDSNGNVLPASSGSIRIFISAATSSALTFDRGRYDLEIYSGSGDNVIVNKLLTGTVKLRKEVTTS
tara:strand:+ start:1191 stop:1598 length:408 start_codon:yes stop_codon:yes gene_type:complete